ncbi:MAG: hypothetical protein IH617_13435 [Hydrogenophaga sp.]|nr:hypothetical protein [Hydrogenophaga sp.]
MRKGKVGVLPETVSVATAAQFLGGIEFATELLHMISDGDLFSWTHSPSTGSLREKTNHRVGGTREQLPRIALDTPPETVIVITEELKGLFYHYDVPWPPGTGKASSWDGVSPLEDFIQLATSRKSKVKRAPWTEQELALLWACFKSMGGRQKRGAVPQLIKELRAHGYALTAQSLREQIKRAESQLESSSKGGGARPSMRMQKVWPASKAGRK